MKGRSGSGMALNKISVKGIIPVRVPAAKPNNLLSGHRDKNRLIGVVNKIRSYPASVTGYNITFGDGNLETPEKSKTG